MKYKNAISIILLLSLLFNTTLAAGTAFPNGTSGPDIWGKNGEKWDKNKLLDYSFSGYAAKEREFADPPFVANVLDFGARGDGEYDNTGPFQAAISKAAASNGGTIIIPKGKYVLKDRLIVNSSNTVLKGDGPGKTILFFPKSLASLDGKSDSSMLKVVESPYSWNGGIISFKGDHIVTSDDSSTLISRVTESSPIGSRTLQLSDASSIQPGMWVIILLSDTNGTLVRSLYGSILDKKDCKGVGNRRCGSELDGEKDLVRWMFRVASVDGNSITLQRALPVQVDARTMHPQIHRVPETAPKDVGARDMTVEFEWERAAPHHKEKGFNAFYFDGVVNAFLSNIEVLNVDSGLLIRNSHYMTVNNVRVGSNPSRAWALPYEGHIGIGMYDSSDIEVSDFDINGEWLHDLAVRGTMFAVFSNGKGANVNMDTHRSAPYATLFSNINLGKGLRPFGTGGHLARGFPAARFTTYYNLRNMRWQPLSLPGTTIAGNCTWGYDVNYVGAWVGDVCPGYHIENYQMGTLQPQDLYEAMLARKIRERAAGNAALPTAAVAVVDNSLPVNNNKATKEATIVDDVPAAGDGSYPIIQAPDIY